MSRNLFSLLQASQPRPEGAVESPSVVEVQREALERWRHDPVTIAVIKAFVDKRDTLRAKLEKDAAAEYLDDRQIRLSLLQVNALSELIEILKSNE